MPRKIPPIHISAGRRSVYERGNGYFERDSRCCENPLEKAYEMFQRLPEGLRKEIIAAQLKHCYHSNSAEV